MKKSIISILLLVIILNMCIITKQNIVYATDPEVKWLDKKYDVIDNFIDGLARVELNGKYGFIDKTGKEVVSLKYDYISYFSEGFAQVELNKKKGFIDKTGKEVTEIKYYMTGAFSSGLARVGYNNDQFGFIDHSGKEVIPLEYSFVFDFHDGLAIVYLNGEVGFIDKSGKVVVPLQYTDAKEFSEGLAIVTLYDDGDDYFKYGYIDKTGKVVIPIKFLDIDDDQSYGRFSEGLAGVKSNIGIDDQWGYMDKTGKIVIGIKYESIYPFENEFAAVYLNDKGGYINKTGKEVIQLKYDIAWNFQDGIAQVALNEKWGYIDKTGKEVIPLKYDDSFNFYEGLALVELKGKYGYIDKTGKEIIPIEYDSAAFNFNEGLAGVKLKGKWGYIDKTGKVQIPLIYDSATNFYEGIALITLGDKAGIIKKPSIKQNDSKPTEPLQKLISATPTSSKVLVNGKDISFDAYFIEGNNYFKLRDLATIVSDTKKQFEVNWDGNKKAINLISNKSYTPVGGEMIKGKSGNKEAILNTSAIYKDGVKLKLTAYGIDGNNYFKLRDIARTFDIGVTWDNSTKTIGIDTKLRYVED